MNGKYTVFICSTFSDLSEERSSVLESVRRLQLSHDSMEFFGARPNVPLQTCLEEVRKSDIVVVIVSHRYGTIASGLETSYSEAEYNEADSLGKPCLVYMKDEDEPVLVKNIERDPKKLKLLNKWKKTLRARHTVATFRNANEIAVQVAADLSRVLYAIEDKDSESLKETLIQQAEKQASIGRLTSGIADELKNPITAIAVMAQRARTAEPRLDTDQLLTTMTNIERECTRLRDLLSFVREISKPVDSTVTKISINQLITGQVDKISLMPNKENITVEVSLDDSQPTIIGVVRELKLAILNILQNAFESMESNRGLLSIRTQTKRDKVEIAIKDNGIGIPKNKIRNIFDPFFTTKKDGTGLGLCVTRKIVEQHHGQIWAESKPNKGTVFYLVFPKAR